MLNIAVVGYGYWGPNLVRNFADNNATNILFVCDSDETRLKTCKRQYPHIQTTTRYRDVLKNDDVHLVTIATPVSTHFNLAKEALMSGKHVLIEKPMTGKVSEAKKLIELADKKELKIFVDHTYMFTGAVAKIKHLITSDEIGDIYYFDSVRVNLGLFQHDINVIWDLAPHDLAIMDYLIDDNPVSVSAIGSNRIHQKFEDIAHVTVKFQKGIMAHFHVNWMSPVKIRRIIIGGSRKMVVFDDLEADEKVKVYDKGIQVMNVSKDKLYKNLVQYRIGEVHSPVFDRTEALKVEVNHIVDCIKNNKKPISDGESGLKIVRLLESAQRSLRKGGTFVNI